MKNVHLLLATVVVFSFLSCKKEISTSGREVPVTTVDASDAKVLPFKRQTPVYADIDGNIGGYTVALPGTYSTTTKKYPLLISLHGSGEMGNGRSDLWKVQKSSVSYMLYNGLMPKKFVVGTKKFELIIINPQFKANPIADDNVTDIINYAVENYRVDQSRIYLTGTSMGAGIAVKYAYENAGRIAAIVTCGNPQPVISTGVATIAASNLPFWGFHNEQDTLISSRLTIDLVNSINALNPKVKAKITLFPNVVIHNSWITAMKPTYTENNLNVYQWMLQYRR